MFLILKFRVRLLHFVQRQVGGGVVCAAAEAAAISKFCRVSFFFWLFLMTRGGVGAMVPRSEEVLLHPVF